MRLAPRLLVGVDPSRPIDQVRAAIKGWLEVSMKGAGGDGHAAWVAEADGHVIGFVSASEGDHWCGETDAYVGELMVDQRFERRGVAGSLIALVEDWAGQRRLARIRLSTGAANHGARAFYEQHGYSASEVSMIRRLDVTPTT